MSRNAEALKRYRAEAAARGDCYSCRCRPVKPGAKYCYACLERVYLTGKAKRARNPDLGLCALCDRPAVPGLKTCEVHRVRRKQRQQDTYYARLARGECPSCGRKNERRESYCAECVSNINRTTMRRYREHQSAGLCVLCPYPAAPGSVHCEPHRDRQRGYRQAHLARRAA